MCGKSIGNYDHSLGGVTVRPAGMINEMGLEDARRFRSALDSSAPAYILAPEPS